MDPPQMEERLDREIKEEKAAAAGIPVDTPWVDTKFERKSNNASGSDAIDAKEDDAEETRGEEFPKNRNCEPRFHGKNRFFNLMKMANESEL